MTQYADTVAFAVDTTPAPLPDDVAAMVAPSVTVTVDVVPEAPGPLRVELLLYRMAGNPLAPAPPRTGRHRRPAHAS
jgi:hypothetical protein